MKPLGFIMSFHFCSMMKLDQIMTEIRNLKMLPTKYEKSINS